MVHTFERQYKGADELYTKYTWDTSRSLTVPPLMYLRASSLNGATRFWISFHAAASGFLARPTLSCVESINCCRVKLNR